MHQEHFRWRILNNEPHRRIEPPLLNQLALLSGRLSSVFDKELPLSSGLLFSNSFCKKNTALHH